MAPVIDELVLPDIEMIEEDGEPLESAWHRGQINLLIDSVECHFESRTDFYAGGNMFIYYEEEPDKKHRFRGPDFFYVDGVSRTPLRLYWVTWDEGGKFPNVIVELSSRKTIKVDRTIKKDTYEKVFRTPEYFCYDPRKERLDGWRLTDGNYEAIQPDERGWLWSEELQLWLGKRKGKYLGDEGVWLRFFHSDGTVVPISAELAQQRADKEHQRAEAEQKRAKVQQRRADAEQRRAEAEQKRADEERQRREIAEAELARLKAQLASQQQRDNS